MRESELLSHIYRRSADLAGPVVVGPGDDCALLQHDGHLLATTDQLILGRHAEPDTPVDLLARKAIARAVSDIAAMAGRPLAGLAAATLPDGYPHADELFDRCARWARELGCPLAGGDIAVADGPLALTLTILGAPHPTRGAVLRSEATPGDHVYVTGKLGGSLASGRHLTFDPRLAEADALATALGDRLHAMIDLSDGLGIDAARVASASGLRIEIEAALIPRHGDVAAWRAAASDGEDYELCFTSAAPPDEVQHALADLHTPVARVGSVRDGAGCVIIDEAGEHDASALGWDHGS